MIRISNQDVETAKNLLLAGEVVAIPTETVYGLAADIRNESAIRKVFSLKERPFFDPLIVHVASLKQAKALTTDWNPLTDFVARYFWPGPLTLILPKSPDVNPLITSGLNTVAVRFPKHDLACELIRQVGPLAAPSANKFGRTSPTEAHHVRKEFKNLDIFVLDGGACEIGIESTVIEIASDMSQISILRPGQIGMLELQEALRKWSHPVRLEKNVSHKSPGHTEHHYMPSLPFILMLKGESLSEIKVTPGLGHHTSQGVELKLSAEPEQAARELYSQMRIVSLSPEAQFIYYFLPEENVSDPSWDAVLDRIQRASQYKSAKVSQALQKKLS